MRRRWPIGRGCDVSTDVYRHEFPLEDELVYLNHAAVAPWPQRTVDAVARFPDMLRQAFRVRGDRVQTDKFAQSWAGRPLPAIEPTRILRPKRVSRVLFVVDAPQELLNVRGVCCRFSKRRGRNRRSRPRPSSACAG